MSDELYLREDLAEAWRGKDAFAQVFQLEGEVARAVAERSTIRATIGGRWFYAKRHGGVGWREIIKNWVTFKAPVVDASNEYVANTALAQLGVATLPVAGFGRRGRNPARRQSFLVTDEIAPVVSLEEFCLQWPEQPPARNLKRRLIREVARIARTMHGAGFNHRDFYICHFLLKTDADAVSAQLYLIDLHRAQHRNKVPHRWLVKDLGGLYYSTFDIGLTQRDVLYFLAEYFEQPIRQLLVEHSALLQQVSARAHNLYGEAQRKGILPRQMAGLSG